MSTLPSNSLQEGEHNLQEMKTKSPAWSSKGHHMYDKRGTNLIRKLKYCGDFSIHLPKITPEITKIEFELALQSLLLQGSHTPFWEWGRGL